MTAMPPEPGSYRGAEELTTLTAETLAPLDPFELAAQYAHDPNQLRALAGEELSKADLLSGQAQELREALIALDALATDARARAAVYEAAFSIAQGDANGS